MTVNEIIKYKETQLLEYAQIIVNKVEYIDYTVGDPNYCIKLGIETEWAGLISDCIGLLDNEMNITFLLIKIQWVMAEIIKQEIAKVPVKAKSKTVFYNVGQGLMVGLFLLEKLKKILVHFSSKTGYASIYAQPEVSIYLYDCGSKKILNSLRTK